MPRSGGGIPLDLTDTTRKPGKELDTVIRAMDRILRSQMMSVHALLKKDNWVAP